MDDYTDGPLPWELLEGEEFTIQRLPGDFWNPRPSIYITDDDPVAGVGIDRVEVLDDLIARLQQAREWLKEQEGETQT